MSDNFNPTFQIPNLGYRGPTNSHAQNKAWKDVLFDQQRMLEHIERLQRVQRNYAHVFSMEQDGIRQQMQAIQGLPVEPEVIDPLYGKRMKVRFSDPSSILQHTGSIHADHRLVTLKATNRIGKLTMRSLGGSLFFPENSLQIQYIDQDGNVLEADASWQIEATDWQYAIDDDPRTFFFHRISVPADSNLTGIGMRLIASVDRNSQNPSCNLLEVRPFPEYLISVRQVTMMTGIWDGIPLATDPNRANLEHRPLFAQAGYRGNFHQSGDPALATSRQIYSFPTQDVVSVEVDLWQPQGVLEGDRRVFTIGCNNLFLGLADFANDATFRLNLTRPAEGWSKVTKLDPILKVDGQPPFALASILDTRLGYQRPDGILGYAAFGESLPNPEEIALDLVMRMDPILKAPPLLYGFDLYYRP